MSDYIDLGNLLRVALWSLGASTALALVYGLGVVGMSRARSAPGGATLARAGSVVAFAAFAAAIAVGIVLMSQK